MRQNLELHFSGSQHDEDLDAEECITIVAEEFVDLTEARKKRMDDQAEEDYRNRTD